ncbi:hypothetical protein, partial [Nocardia brasiliensis]|uniref:hypothetical protein n=1 Tax=Nocardia brasiliensis TaxID=37326 RepID=UPI0024585493
ASPRRVGGGGRLGGRAADTWPRPGGWGAGGGPGTWFGTSEGLLGPNWVGRLGGTACRKALRRKPCARG